METTFDAWRMLVEQDLGNLIRRRHRAGIGFVVLGEPGRRTRPENLAGEPRQGTRKPAGEFSRGTCLQRVWKSSFGMCKELAGKPPPCYKEHFDYLSWRLLAYERKRWGVVFPMETMTRNREAEKLRN